MALRQRPRAGRRAGLPRLGLQRGPGYPRVCNGQIDIGAFEVQGTPSPPPFFAVSGCPAVVTAGEPVTVTVTALNPDGSTDTDYDGTVDLSTTVVVNSLGDTQTESLGSSALTDGTGILSVTWQLAGPDQFLAAQDDADSTLYGSEPGITVVPAPASQMTLTWAVYGGNLDGSGLTTGPLSAVQVTLLDSFGNIASAANGGTVQLSASGPSGFAEGSTTTAAVVNGVATFGNLALDASGVYRLVASSPGVPQADSVVLTIKPSSPGRPGGSPLDNAAAVFFTDIGTAQLGGFLADPRQFDLYRVPWGPTTCSAPAPAARRPAAAWPRCCASSVRRGRRWRWTTRRAATRR